MSRSPLLPPRSRATPAEVLWLLLAFAGAAHAASLPHIAYEPWATGFEQPVYVTDAGPRLSHLFVVEQAGRIMTVSRDRPAEHAVFLDLRDRVASGGEKGLLSAAFHPDFARNRRFFVNYTTGGKGKLRTHVSEFRARPDLGRADPAEEKVLLDFEQPYENHNGGLLLFAPDGTLYVGVGDGGAANDPRNVGQSLDTLLGKILRIEVDHVPPGQNYGIPKSNPFVGRVGARPEIWAYGLRNPWRFSFDRLTRALYAGDVGQNHREEIDLIVRGGNYGWRIMEGFIATPGLAPAEPESPLLPPIVDYPRSDGVSVTGGYVYRGAAHPSLRGAYFYADYANGRTWALRLDGTRVLEQAEVGRCPEPLTSFGEDHLGELYATGYRGTVFRIKPAATE